MTRHSGLVYNRNALCSITDLVAVVNRFYIALFILRSPADSMRAVLSHAVLSEIKN